MPGNNDTPAPPLLPAEGTPAVWWKSASFWIKTFAALVILAAFLWTVRATDRLAQLGAQVQWAFVAPPAEIYVESPEVYTRERLINERSAEEAWLTAQLKGIDEEDLSSTNIVERLLDEATLTAGGSAQAPGTTPAPGSAAKPEAASQTATDSEANPSPRLTFDQDFRLRSAYRNLVRQRMIENRLDDRHDLEGNALYILKFDSTVLGVPAFNERAVIKVRILPPGALNGLTAQDRNVLEALDSQVDVLGYAEDNFGLWQRSLLQRMNKELTAELTKIRSADLGNSEDGKALLEQIAASVDQGKLQGLSIATILGAINSGELLGAIESAEQLNQQQAVIAGVEEVYYYLARQAIAKVTGDNFLDVAVIRPTGTATAVAGTGIRQVTLTSPLTRDFVLITLKFAPVASAAPLLEIYPAATNLFITDTQCDFAKEETYPDYFKALTEGDFALWQHFQQQLPAGDDMLSSIITLVSRKLDKPNMRQGVLKASRNDPDLGCTKKIGVWVESGLINFSRRIGKFNTYSYSVLPRENPISVFSDIASTTKAAANFGNVQSGRILQHQTGGWELRPVLSTFGDTVQVKTGGNQKPSPATQNPNPPSTAPRPGTEPVVGWIIDLSAQAVSAARLSQPVTVNESVIAIVSVPAWWSEIDVGVERGWLGEESLRSELSYSVKLPNRAELLDTLLFGDVGRQPYISDVDQVGLASAGNCDDAAILIAGQRLWRNTAVTIGSTKADQVEVLPNMEGIIAKFTGKQKSSAADPKQQDIKGKLRVWTSHGVHEFPTPVDISFPGNC